MTTFGDYIVYVDESGDHSLVEIDTDFPVFVLAFCIFPVDQYVESIVPSVERLKFDYFGHDMVILHEREIRQSKAPFDILLNAETRASFLARLSATIDAARFGVVACVIRKQEFKKRVGVDTNPYHVALEYGLERVFMQLQQRNQRGRKTYVIFEGRGRKEDAQLELEFRRIMDTTRMRGMADTLAFKCVSKMSNSTGLQLADMVARPIGVHVLRPDQPNQAWDVIARRIPKSPGGTMHGYGLKIYP